MCGSFVQISQLFAQANYRLLSCHVADPFSFGRSSKPCANDRNSANAARYVSRRNCVEWRTGSNRIYGKSKLMEMAACGAFGSSSEKLKAVTSSALVA